MRFNDLMVENKLVHGDSLDKAFVLNFKYKLYSLFFVKKLKVNSSIIRKPTILFAISYVVK